MDEEQETNHGVRAAILIAGILVVAFLIWLGGRDDRPGIATERASAPAAPQAETRQSLDTMAENYFSGGHYDAAIGVYRKILAREPNDAAVLNELGLALHYSAKSEEALEALEKATALDPKLQRAWLSYGFVLKSLGREKQARAALKQTIALGPATPQGIEAQAMLAR